MGNSSTKDSNVDLPQIEYEVSVKTGDKKYAGSDSSVGIVLRGEGLKSEKVWLDHFLRNDFERGQKDDFTIKAIQLNKIDAIELSRGFAIIDEWFVDTVEVKNGETGQRFLFPIHRWLKPRSTVKIAHLDTSLPQYEMFKEQRQDELQRKRTQYQLDVKIPGLPPQVKKVPSDEQFSFSYLFDLGTKAAAIKLEAFKTKRYIPGKKWKDLEHIKSAYPSEILPMPDNQLCGSYYVKTRRNDRKYLFCSEYSSDWSEDETFGHQRIAAVNNSVIKLCQSIRSKFPVTEEMIKPFLQGMSLEAAMDANRLFIIDYEIMEGISSKPEFMIFLPSDPEYTWMMAKLWFNNADTAYHQSITHLALKSLIGKGKWVDQTMNIGRPGMFDLIDKKMKTWRLDTEGTVRQDMSNRGVLSSSILLDYHFREDALKLFDIIEKYVKGYVDIYYADDSARLTGDWEVQRWIQEIIRPVKENGVGLKGVPCGKNGKIETKAQLVSILTSIIYTCSVGHAAANFQQYDEYGFPPNYPAYMNGKPPKDKTPLTEQDILDTLPDQGVTLSIMTITKVLSEKATNSLGYFEVKYIYDTDALVVLKQFIDDLQELSDEIQNNTDRSPPYKWLNPKNVPNAISM